MSIGVDSKCFSYSLWRRRESNAELNALGDTGKQPNASGCVGDSAVCAEPARTIARDDVGSDSSPCNDVTSFAAALVDLLAQAKRDGREVEFLAAVRWVLARMEDAGGDQ